MTAEAQVMRAVFDVSVLAPRSACAQHTHTQHKLVISRLCRSLTYPYRGGSAEAMSAVMAHRLDRPLVTPSVRIRFPPPPLYQHTHTHLRHSASHHPARSATSSSSHSVSVCLRLGSGEPLRRALLLFRSLLFSPLCGPMRRVEENGQRRNCSTLVGWVMASAKRL